MAANRGEIAVRITRAGLELGLQTLAIYSAADRLQPHRFKADESYQVGSKDMTPVQCYLDYSGIVKLAKAQGVDVIHPGYGFLSENSNFARECAGEWYYGTNEPIMSSDDAKVFAGSIGYPVMIKARSGGGGRGMRVVRGEDEMDELFQRASNEAAAAFGDGAMFVEKFVEDPRHIEIQILADNYGNVVHLYERDCSVQRRHQKVVEIAPAPNLSDDIRQQLYTDAVKIAKHCGIQVEHTVTEEITGVDLVQAQIKIAGGKSLAEIGFDGQENVPAPNGYAIQCRVTTEDPERNFQPDFGRISAYRSAGGPGVRLDGAMGSGNTISPFYDSLLVKVICKASSFAATVQKMQRALYEFHVRGVKTNIPFLENVFHHSEFLSGEATTSFIENHPELFDFGASGASESHKVLSYLAEMIVNGPKHPGAVGPPPPKITPLDPVIPQDCDPAIPPTGWRNVLLAKGPEGWAAAVREHRKTEVSCD
eukprot:jgi/Picre1/32718/NNA_008063.t1